MSPFDAAIVTLLDAGYVEDGRTQSFTTREGSSSSILLGGGGGRLATSGGRLRLAKPGTALRATVGKITTSLYEIDAGKAVNMVSFPTKDMDTLRKALGLDVMAPHSP